MLVTGGAGVIGSNIADRLLADGHRVRIYDGLARAGVEANLQWLQRRHGDRVEALAGALAGSLSNVYPPCATWPPRWR